MRETERFIIIGCNRIQVAKDSWQKRLQGETSGVSQAISQTFPEESDAHATRHVVHAPQVRAAKDPELMPIYKVSGLLHDLVIDAVQERLVVDRLDVHVVKDVVKIVHGDRTPIHNGPDGVEEARHLFALLLELVRVVQFLRGLSKGVTVGPTFKRSGLLRLDCALIKISEPLEKRQNSGGAYSKRWTHTGSHPVEM